MALRDLREDLRHRLKLIELERAQINARLGSLSETEEHIKSLLGFEEMRIKSEQHNLALPFMVSAQMDAPPETSGPYGQFLLNILSDGKTWTLDELKKAASDAGLNFEQKLPGRVLHFALLGLAQQDLVEMVAKSTWRKLGEGERKESLA